MTKYKESDEATDFVKESEISNECVICKGSNIVGKIYGKDVCHTCVNDAFALEK